MVIRLTLYFLLVGVFYWYCSSDGHLWSGREYTGKKINLSSVKMGGYADPALVAQDSLMQQALDEKQGTSPLKQQNSLVSRFGFDTKESL